MYDICTYACIIRLDFVNRLIDDTIIICMLAFGIDLFLLICLTITIAAESSQQFIN